MTFKQLMSHERFMRLLSAILQHNYQSGVTADPWKCSLRFTMLFSTIKYLQSQPEVSGHPQKKALPRFPSFNVATMMSTFLSIFFWTCKTTLGRGYGGKGSHCPMLLSEIVVLSLLDSFHCLIQNQPAILFVCNLVPMAIRVPSFVKFSLETREPGDGFGKAAIAKLIASWSTTSQHLLSCC